VTFFTNINGEERKFPKATSLKMPPKGRDNQGRPQTQQIVEQQEEWTTKREEYCHRECVVQM
jgi:hypothetical protein